MKPENILLKTYELINRRLKDQINEREFMAKLSEVATEIKFYFDFKKEKREEIKTAYIEFNCNCGTQFFYAGDGKFLTERYTPLDEEYYQDLKNCPNCGEDLEKILSEKR